VYNPLSGDTLYEHSLKLLETKATEVNPNNFSFVFMGDSWVGEGYTSEQMFQAALTEAKKQNPLFILHGGDAIFRGATNPETKFPRFLEWVNTYADGIPMFVVPGNHDSESLDGPSYKNFEFFIGPRRFNIVNNSLSLRLVGIDPCWTRTPQGNTYFLSDETLDFLNEALQIRKKRTFVISHVAPFAGKWRFSFENEDSAFRKGVSRFLSIISRKVSRVFVSHVHLYDSAVIKSIRYIFSGGAGAALVKEHTFHIIVVQVRNGVITHEFVPVGWTA
jgi:hypothetical protein